MIHLKYKSFFQTKGKNVLAMVASIVMQIVRHHRHSIILDMVIKNMKLPKNWKKTISKV